MSILLKKMNSVLALLLVLPLVIANTCSYSKGNISANWSTSNNITTINYQHSDLQNNQYTAIGFGTSMKDLKVVLFTISNNQANVQTGYTTGFAAPTILYSSTSTTGVVQQLNYSGNTLTATLNFPASTASYFGINQCGTWNFLDTGSYTNGQIQVHSSVPAQVQNVCAQQC